MSEIFLSLDEAAELEGITYNCIWKRIKKNEGRFIVKKEKSENGGRENVYIALSSLSPKARRTYKRRNPTETEMVLMEQKKLSSIPWYAEDSFDFSWYRKNYKEQYEAAISIAADIKAFLDYNEKERTAFAAEFADSMDISMRTLYRYSENYLEAEELAIRKKKETGKTYEHYKILAMCRKPRNGNTFPSLKPEHRAFIENLWFSEGFSENNGNVEELYKQFERFFKESDMEYPSYKTVVRYINYLINNCGMKNAKDMAARGIREWRRNNMIKGVRDSSALAVMEIIQGDSHTFDFWVEYHDPHNGKVSAIRPTMVAWIDTRSRVVMGDVWAKNVNAQVIKQSMAKVVYKYGVPEYIIIDNGKDYTANEMTGRSRKQRSSSLLELDEEAKSFYRSIGIKDDYRALPYQPWVKIIERHFRTVCNQFSKWFASYTGTLTGSKTSDKVNKDIGKMLKNGKLLTMDEAFALWEMWLKDTYHAKPHRGLQRMKELYTKPMELFEKAEERIMIPPPASELMETLLLKPGRARIYNTGINKFGQNYMNYALATHIGETLPIRYDPMDMAKIYVYDNDGKKICAAECQELLGYQGHISQQQLEEHMKLQKMQEQEDKARLAAARTPLELRGYEGDLVTGSLNFMIEKTKAQAIECKTETNSEAEPDKDTISGYFASKAKQELSRLRRLNKEGF